MGEIALSPIIMQNLLHKLVRYYQFAHGNESPTKIIVPRLTKVDGIIVEYAKQPEPKPSDDIDINKAKEVLDAVTSRQPNP